MENIKEKKCSKCKNKKSIDEFSIDKKCKDGRDYWCKKCKSNSNKEYRKNNKEKTRKQNKKWRKNNYERVRKTSKKWRENNSDKTKGYQRKWKEKNPHSDENYRKNNIKKIRECRRKYEAKRRGNDPIYRLNQSISAVIRYSLKGNKKGMAWESVVGYNTKQLKEHLEKQFKDGMAWENYGKGGWEIDHKIPISIFNINGIKSKGFKSAWELQNLRPMFNCPY